MNTQLRGHVCGERSPTSRSHRRPAPFSAPPYRLVYVRSSSNDDPEPQNLEALREKFFRANSGEGASSSQPAKDAPSELGLNAINPYELGRQARAAFNDVWEQLSRVTSPTRSFIIDDVLQVESDADFLAPQAAYTTVLVVGATGRVGRILIRKLLLRGYRVKALFRNRAGVSKDAIPDAVEVVEGDVGDMATCQKAVEGVNKVIFCAAARSVFTSDLLRVEDRGVMNVVKAMQDELHRRARRSGARFNPSAKKEVADFSSRFHQDAWDVRFVGNPEEAAAAAEGRPVARAATDAYGNRLNFAEAVITDDDNLLFEGTLLQRGAIAEVGAPLTSLLPGGEHRTAGTEGLVLRVRGDGHSFLCILETAGGHRYGARFPTREGYLTVRLPYGAFRSEFQGQPPLDPANLTAIGLRYENRRGASAAVAALRAAKGLDERAMNEVAAAMAKDQKFSLEVDWIKALPAGTEPDVVLVSCAGRSRPGVDPADLRKVIEAKRRGEQHLRHSGLGYTIIRPGTLLEEPGGYRALVFDQGDRITESISAADVADICLRALHEPEGRNKTFDVCYEYQADENNALYELIAHVPDKKNNYLKAAVASLARNT